jgi:triosephosphate isomerase
MKALVIGNWKMNPPTFREAQKLLDATKRAAEVTTLSVIVVPPAIFLRDLTARMRSGRIAFGVQHAHFEVGGAHTGDISMRQAKDAKATYVLIGHAERRGLGETNDDTRKKVAAALETGLSPILCVGETIRSTNGEYFAVITEQLRIALADVPVSRLGRVIIVYEPLWTIGADTTMSPRDMHEMSIFIRKTVVDLHGDVGHKMKVLYGGSVNADNASVMVREGDIHGFLLGRASWNAVEFTKLLQAVAQA